MKAAILLDSGPVGVLTNPRHRPHVLACRAWLHALQAAGRRVVLPEIADYEVRRELHRLPSPGAIQNLDQLGLSLEYLPIDTPTIRLAAELWAWSRQTGQQTAPDHALDGDVILVAQAILLNTTVVIATTNAAHLSPFVPAELWSNIAP